MLIGRPFCVVGAGIAGLATAIALAQRGAQVELREQAAALGDVGAGLQLSPNGGRVIRALGLWEDVAGEAVESAGALLRNQRGRLVARVDLSRFGPVHLVHRADLIARLAERAEAVGVTLNLGTPFDPAQDLEPLTQSGVTVIGADGVRSAVRDQIAPGPKPGFSGQVAWRALIPIDGHIAPEAQVFMGAGQHLVAYPIRGGRLLNLVAVEERRAWQAEGWAHPGDPAQMRRTFGAFGGPVPDWLAQVDTCYVWGLFKRPVADLWHRDGAILVGDAAHPTLPFLAQGACLGLEDAWVLAAALDQRGPDGAALYQELRAGRARRVVDAATANARNYHVRSPVLQAVGHTGLRAISRLAPAALAGKFAWLYGYDATQAL